MLLGQVLFALNWRYLINEKGALAEATAFPHTLNRLIGRTDAIWLAVRNAEFASALAILQMLDGESRALMQAVSVE